MPESSGEFRQINFRVTHEEYAAIAIFAENEDMSETVAKISIITEHFTNMITNDS